MFTYVIRDGSSQYVKVGKSVRPKDRLRSLQTGQARRLLLLGMIGDDREQALHARMRADCVRGEWFRLTDDVKHVLTEAFPGIVLRRPLVDLPSDFARRMSPKLRTMQIKAKNSARFWNSRQTEPDYPVPTDEVAERVGLFREEVEELCNYSYLPCLVRDCHVRGYGKFLRALAKWWDAKAKELV